MKYAIFSLVVILAGLALMNTHSALAIGQSFGGKISSTTYANVYCTGGTGPVSIQPVGTAASSYYFFPISIKGSSPQSSKQFLGKYSGSSSNCIQDDGIEKHTFPTINVTLYKISQQVQIIGGRYKF